MSLNVATLASRLLRRFNKKVAPAPRNLNRFRPILEQCEAREVPALFVVNSGGDRPDSNLGDGIASTGVMLPNGQVEVTLRAAIQEANALNNQLNPQDISFQVPPNPMVDDGPPPPLPTFTVVLTQPMEDIRVQLSITGYAKDSVIITHAAGSDFTYFTVANGAIVPKDISVSFSNLTIRDAVAPNATNGGAIHNSAILTLTNVVLRDNKATSGGAIFNSGSGKLILYTTSFIGNEATQDGGAICGTGASTLLAYDSEFTSNKAAVKGGAIAFNLTSRAELIDTDFIGNEGNRGGAIYVSFAGDSTIVALQMWGGRVANNISSNQGGAQGVRTMNRRRCEGLCLHRGYQEDTPCRFH